MRSRLSICLSLCLLGALLGGVPAEAAKRKAPASKIELVAPMRVSVGETITVRGAGFSSVRKRNTVIFRAADRRVAFAKPRRAGRRKLVVRIPASVERILVNRDDKGVGSPTRLRLRVLVQRRYGKLSLRRNSPVVESALGGGGPDGGGPDGGGPDGGGPPPPPCGKGSDFDGDLLPNSTEAAIKTDPCNRDTDGDGVEDGFEHFSALDLNQQAVPYPGERPFSNALDASDAGNDYDGDGLSLMEEFRAWARPAANPTPSMPQFYTDNLRAPAFAGPYGTRPTFGDHKLPLNYSDGKQASLEIRRGDPEYRDSLDYDGNGWLTDDERDVDGDGLRNIDEIRGLMWQAYYPSGDECGYEYRPALPRDFLQVDYLDWDSDGDGVWDGDDDQDNDGVSNVDEVSNLDGVQPPYQECGGASPLPINGARDPNEVEVLRHPYNPCLPYRSDTCARYGLRD